MKKLVTLLALTIGFSMNAQLEPVTEGSNTGQRLSTSNAANHGDIGSNAVDLSYQGSSSSTRGATGSSSTAMGYGGTASGDYSTAMGDLTTASGYGSTAIGKSTTASGTYSTAMGRSAIASDYVSLAIGQYNNSLSSVTTNGSATSYDADNTAFVIGNGTSGIAKSDAFKVMFNGDATVSGGLTVSGDVNVSSDARLKSNIISLGSTLSKLLLIDGKSYTMINDGDKKIGVLAQDIQKVFPELVSTDDKDMLTVNYQGLVPVLINAIKEQDAKIERLESLVEQLINNK